ncbi:MAG: ABC transporter substrate-binding protein [Nitrososphaerales archaeon]
MYTGSHSQAITKIHASIIIVIVVVAAVVGGVAYMSSTGTKAANTSSSGLQNLITQANQEGSVTIYSTATTTALQAIAQAFEKQYPSITVNTWSGASNDLVTKVQSEAQGGINAVDVISPTYLTFEVLNGSNLFTAYTPPAATNISSSDTIGNVCYGSANYIVTLNYNTKLVNQSQLPTTWWQLVQNSSWAGRIGMPDPTLHFTTAQWLLALQQIFPKNWTQFVSALSALHPKFYHSLTPVSGGVASGDVAIGIGLASDGATLKLQGAPIGVDYLQPTLKFDTYVCLAAKAPHPAAAKLLMNWMLTKAGMQAEANIGDQMVLPTSGAVFPVPAGINVYVFGQQSVNATTTAMQTTFKQIFFG